MTTSANMTLAQYRACKGVNWSALKHYGHSPAHYRAHVDAPPKQTEEMQTGSALHAIVLEGEEVFASRYAVAPEGVKRNTKAGKDEWAAFEAANEGKEIIKPEQAESVRAMAAALAAHPAAARLLARCREREKSIFWEDPATGVSCKGRLDGFDPAGAIVLDLKTARDASPRGFARAAADLGYHGQAAFYLNGLAASGLSARFVFAVVEKTPPFAVALYHIDGDELAAGRQLAARYLDLHARCIEANEWPGYAPDVQTLALPRWALA